jgi:ribosome biogenesis GTPase A
MRSTLRLLTSKRQEFKQIQPDKKLLDYFDKAGLGRPSEKVTRKLVAIKRRNFGLSVNRHQPSRFPIVEKDVPPHPFNRGPKSVNVVKKIIQIEEFKDLPDYGNVPEVAVIGRSNVGKSTLLNALLGFTSHIQQAKVSARPGETKKLQFFAIGSFNNKVSKPKLAIVDMPGYGFSYMAEKQAEKIAKLVC